MIIQTDVNFNKNSRPRGRISQQGTSMRGPLPRPIVSRLKAYSDVAFYDGHVRGCLKVLIDAVVSSTSEITHPDKDIQEFLRYNIKWLIEERGVDFKQILKGLIKSTLWAGFSVSEKLMLVHEGKLLLEDVVNYNPSTLTIVTNKRGRLVEGEESYEAMLKSGIYQTAPDKLHQPISLWKACYLVNEFEFNNYYGRSIIEPMYKWHILKEALVDMMTVALDRFGNPIVSFTVPHMFSNQKVVDEETGEERMLTAQEVMQEQLANNSFGEGNVIILPQVDKDLKPEVNVITTGNNVGSMYLDAINLCERQQSKCLLIPYGFLEGGQDSPVRLTERHVEIFNRIVSNCHETFIVPAVIQILHPIIKFNFNRESAKIPPSLPLGNPTRPEDRVALMQMIKGLTSDGYLNPTQDADWEMVRQMVGANYRTQDEKDIEFIKQLLIWPRNPDASPYPPKQPAGTSTNNLNKTKAKTNPERDRSTEGKVNGAGGRGRPSGVSTPHQNPRGLS